MQDLIIVGVLVCVGVLLLKADLPLWAAAFVWPVYWYTQVCVPLLPISTHCSLCHICVRAQGSVMTGVWVIAHECGHQAFSPYKWLNNAVGLVCHSALLVPYHSWRITHGNHHKNTCSMENDEVFVPPTRSAVMKGVELLEDSPAWNLFGIVNMLLLGW